MGILYCQKSNKCSVELSETDERGSASRGTRRKSDKERYSATQYDDADRTVCGGSVRTTNGSETGPNRQATETYFRNLPNEGM